MRTHFLSVLGTGLYEPVIYGFQGDSGTLEQEFVQIALMERFAGQLKDGKITILLTDGARRSNWENRAYTGKDVEFSGRWVSGKKQLVRENDTKTGMKTTLRENYPELYGRTEDISIRNASTDEEIWSVFETIYNAIDEGDEIIFDITHSFRSIPMLAMTIINYAKVMKKCTLKGIYYGAYEAAEVRDGVKHAPIVDLTVYNEILEWTNAAEAFMQYGVAAKMKEVYEGKMKSVAGDKREWAPIRKKVNAMQDLSMAIFTCRGTDMDELDKELGTNDKNKAKKSIKNAYAALAQQNTKESENKAREMKPLYPLLEKIGDSYRTYFDKEDNVGVGLGMVEWSIKNNMIQQGYTALEETMTTYLCMHYGIGELTEKTRGQIVGRTITGIIRECQPLEKLDNDREGVLQVLIEKDFSDKGEADREKIREIVRTIPVNFIQQCDKVKGRRNDINHFGFREFPAKSDALGVDLKDCYDDFVKIMAEMDRDETLEAEGEKGSGK